MAIAEGGESGEVTTRGEMFLVAIASRFSRTVRRSQGDLFLLEMESKLMNCLVISRETWSADHSQSARP
jgi:hypothetical protein